MKIKKIGHCCMIIDEAGVKILTDPGGWTSAQNEITGVNIVLITHEHPDHFHLDSLKTILKNNPDAVVITNGGVGKLLDDASIAYRIMERGQEDSSLGVRIEGFGERHADIYPTITPVANTGYFIANQLFYPGDAFTRPGKPVEILALPVAGPWLLLSEAIDYAKMINPKVCFPVHDGMLNEFGSVFHLLPQKILGASKIPFITPDRVMEF